MLRKKILSAIGVWAFASAALASTQDVERTEMVITAESALANDMSVDLTENSIAFNASEEISSIFVTEFVVAAHYMATRELPDKVVFVAGEQVVSIHAYANVLPRNTANRTNLSEVGWQVRAYHF